MNFGRGIRDVFLLLDSHLWTLRDSFSNFLGCNSVNGHSNRYGTRISGAVDTYFYFPN